MSVKETEQARHQLQPETSTIKPDRKIDYNIY